MTRIHRNTSIAVGSLSAVLLFSAVGNVGKQAPTRSAEFTGYVSDRRCGKKVDAECNRQCFEQGAAPVLVLDESHEVLSVSNADELKKYLGAYVRVTAKRSGDELTIEKVEPIK